jgi:hypothetical protein
LPIAPDFRGYGEIILTGGEPLLYPDVLWDEIERIRSRTLAFIYLYTAKVDNPWAFLHTLLRVHGLTLTIHKQEDVKGFLTLQKYLDDFYSEIKYKSMRLAVRKGIILNDVSHYWKVSYWEPMEVCPVPQGEVFMKLRP